MSEAEKYHALRVDPDICFGCTHCMKSCPTEAIRIINGLAVIDAERCVDCGNCLRACPVKAIYVKHDALSRIEDFRYPVVLFPSVFIGQFSEVYSEDQIYEALLMLGFSHIVEVEQPVELLMESIRESRQEVDPGPIISSFCPAIVRLIQCKYPSLVKNIARRKAPHDLAAHLALDQLKAKGIKEQDIGLFYVSPCSAKMAAVNQPVAEERSIVTGIINMKELYNRVMRMLPSTKNGDTSEYRKYLSREGILWSLPRGETAWYRKRSMAIDGIHNVVRFLERLENNEVPKLDFLELKSCSQGCAGGILLTGNRFLTVERLQKRAARYPRSGHADLKALDVASLKQKLITDIIEPNPVFALDEKRSRALIKMELIRKILCQLPAIDCGACGAPNCHALAEDVVGGRARITDCIVLQNKYVIEKKITPENARKNLDRRWGKGRFDSDCKRKGKRNEGF